MDRTPSCSRLAWVRCCLLVVLLCAATPRGAQAGFWSGKHKVAVSTTSTHTLHAPEVGRIVDWLHRVVDMEPRLRSDMVRVEHVLRDTTKDLADSAREASKLLVEAASKAQTSAQEILSLAHQAHDLAVHVADTAFRVSVFITVFVTGSAMALLATWNGAPVAEVLNRLWLVGLCGSAALVLARVLAGPLFIDDWALAGLGIFPVILSIRATKSWLPEDASVPARGLLNLAVTATVCGAFVFAMAGTPPTQPFLPTFGNTPSGATGGGNVPCGTLVPFLGEAIPDGWLLAQGQLESAHDFPCLAAALGEPAMVGSSVFVVPNASGRVLEGSSTEGAQPRRRLDTFGVPDTSVQLKAENLPSFTLQYGDVFFSERGGSVVTTGLGTGARNDHDNGGHEIQRTATYDGQQLPVNIARSTLVVDWIIRAK